jgi:hypothetical protein
VIVLSAVFCFEILKLVPEILVVDLVVILDLGGLDEGAE